MTVQVQILMDPDQSQFLAMFSATPGSESEQKLLSLASLSDVSPRHRRSTS
ncbi:hypothetical protein GCM10022223_16660 [Kineosporia mesophila]|uniref:Uncharacterized protein n=1 Tax=Kineosporia mesophila TaxID=566012 RepID=A0ABP6Z9T4_9ACTN